MKTRHFLVILIAVVAIGSIYYFGNIVKPKVVSEEKHQEGDGHEHAPMSMDEITPANFENLLASAKKKVSPQNLGKITDLEQSLAKATSNDQKSAILDSIGRVWYDQKNRLMAAYYVGNSGLLDNSEKKLNFASHLLSEDIKAEQDPALRKFMYDLAKSCYEQSEKINPNDPSVQIDHAMLYIDGAGEIMKGVGMLKAVVDKDPKNIPASIILGKMSIQSGQFDKAVERADAILAVDDSVLDAYLFKADALFKLGKIEQGKAVLEDAKKMMNNPDFSKDVDEYIKNIEK